MSDKKSKSKSRSKSKRSRHSYRDWSTSSDSDSDSHTKYRKKEKSRSHAATPSSLSKNHKHATSSGNGKKNLNISHVKSLVKVALPSLLTPSTPKLSRDRSDMKVKVIQNKSGSEKKGQVAKSLMDLQFQDPSINFMPHIFPSDYGGDRKPSLLPEPYQRLGPAQREEQRNTTKLNNGSKESDWLTVKERKRPRRSWTESEAGPSHTLFNSSYKPLVVESETLSKVQKLPKSLLDSNVLPTLNLSTSSGIQIGMMDRGCQDMRKPDNRIVEISNKKKNDVFLIIPSTLPWVHLHGYAQIKVIKGTVTIMAHTLTPGMYYEVFSPSSNCLLSLQVDPTNFMSIQDVKAEMKTYFSNVIEIQGLSDRSIGIIKVEKHDSVVCDYVTTLPPFTKVFTPRPTADSKKSGVTIFDGSFKVAPESEMGLPCMTWDDTYNKALDRWLETIDKGADGDLSPVLVACGAKNSGKSTFNRCAINTTLRCVPELAYLDVDVGQTEFSPPATMSLHILNKPVLSPPFCHQKHAECMVFFGDATPAQDPSFYIKCLHHVLQAYRTLASGKKLPLIVNTMGFPEGVGYMLFIDTVNLTKPDLVIQFESDQLYTNFPPVTKEMIGLDEGWTFNKCPPPDPKERLSHVKEHTLLHLQSLSRAENIGISHKLHPVDLRSLTMFSALTMGLEQNETLISLTPYTLPYHKIAIHVCRHSLPLHEMLLAVDSSVVALCEADLTQAKRHDEVLFHTFDEMPVCECLGLGLVRGVDYDQGLLYISSTLPHCRLRRVNTILKGTLSIPDPFIMKQQNVSVYPVPYVDSVAQTSAAFGLRARSRMPRIHTRQKRTV